ncbi:MAG: YfcE family phosphodiesterase [Pirellulales bacterium]
MRLGVISDTHGHVANTRNAIRMLESLEVETVLHCGDIGTPEIVEMFAPWPTHFVFGNCDDDRPALRAAIAAAGQTCHEEFGDLELTGVKIALLHSHDRERFRTAIQSGQWHLVCYGHTHVASIDKHGGTTVLNPGAVYRANPHSLAVVELPQLEATIVTL